MLVNKLVNLPSMARNLMNLGKGLDWASLSSMRTAQHHASRGLVTLESGERRALSTRSRNETLRVGRLVFGRREGERLLHVSRPAMGIFDSFTKQWETVKEDTLEQKKQEGFKFQVTYLLKQERVDLGTLKHIITSTAELMGYKGWRKHVPGASSSPEIIEMLRHEKLIDAMSEDLRKNPGNIRGMEKIKLQKATGLTPVEINKTVKMFKEIEQLHKWLRKRAEAGKSIPQSTNQMMQMMMEPDGGMGRKMMLKGQK